ncbi:NAD(P)-binding domain-containing protein [Streptomyces lonarensis]|uniref:NAD(P)-binding domain-containing protein n=2 Tax=Streptomyces lonarensis TaxID=700599 RepID=A0A7X6D005_9ACTN|nr:NAD(P)-binding domain-containing protein [Streptomyces lonarensis]NJQ05673.1 NAD(P)-binding domain-containing protein [Streptomyces lonarensis]
MTERPAVPAAPAPGSPAPPTPRPTVGVLGTGRLGRALAARLAAGPGRDGLAVADRDPAVAARLGGDLGVPALPPPELAARCALVLVCVPPPAAAAAIAACRRGVATGRPGPVFANLATSLPTAVLRRDPALRGATVVGLKPVCQFTAVALGVPTPFLTAAADRLALLRAAVGDLGPVLLTDERGEDAVGEVNRAATRAALRACTALRAELAGLTADPAVAEAAVRNVFAGTALDFPPDPGNAYTAALLRDLAASHGEAAPGAGDPGTAINAAAPDPPTVGGTGHSAARP